MNSVAGAAQSTQSIQASQTQNSVFESVTEEFDLVIDDIEGELPAALRGTLYRNGPSQWQSDCGHVFDGNGMISQFIFSDGQLRYRNRFVRTPKYLAESNGKRLRGLGTERPGGMLANALRPPSDRANTHALFFGEQVLALTDDGRPWRVDADSLATIGSTGFAGRLPITSLFSAHPRIDPQTGELFNFGIALDLRRAPRLPISMNIYRIDVRGKLSVAASFPLDRVHVNHDFVITPNYFVFVLAPITISLGKAMHAGLGLSPFEGAAVFEGARATRFVLVPRNGGKPRIIEHEAFAYVHFNNAYEDGKDVVIDLSLHDSWEASSALLKDFRNINVDHSVGGPLVRFRVSPDNRITRTDLSSLKSEFPQHDWRRTSLPYRYSYLSGTAGNGETAIIKVDNDSGESVLHGFANSAPGEPLFVPRSANGAEDDGWLLCLTCVPEQQRSALFVLDARQPDAPPLAVATLPHQQFPGFHGSFTTRIAR